MRIALFAAAATLAAPSFAQTTLLEDGDVVAGFGTVTDVFNCDVNGQGSWIVEFRTDNPSFDFDDHVMVNGVVKFQEGTSLGISAPAGATLAYADSMDVNSNGDLLFLLNLDLPGGATTSGVYWNDMLLVEQGVTPINAAGVPANSVWESLAEAWQNSSNQILLGGYTNGGIEILVLLDHDGLGNITGETLLTMEGITMPGHNTPVQGLSLTKTRQAINDAGQLMWYVDDENTITTPNDNICCDSWMYLGMSPLFNENDMCPAVPGRTYGHFSTAEVDVNNSGDWVMSCLLDSSDNSNNTVIFRSDNTIVAREGSLAPGVGGGWLISSSAFGGNVELSDSGDVLWTGDWDDPDTTVDSGLFVNQELLLQEGVSTIHGVILDTISTSSDGLAMSDDGRYVVFEGTLNGDINGIYLIDRNDGLGTNYCISVANSTGAASTISASGTGSIAANDLVLTADNLPSQPGIFIAGPGQAQLPFFNGFLCIAQVGLQRFDDTSAPVGGVITEVVDLATSAPGGLNVAAGSTYNFQRWNRDPAGGGGNANFSDAVEILFAP